MYYIHKKPTIVSLLIVLFLFFGCSSSDVPVPEIQSPGGSPAEYDTPDDTNYIPPTEQEYTEAMDDPNGRVYFNGFSVDVIEIDEDKNELYFIISWDISYNNDYFQFYDMNLFIIDKCAYPQS